MAHDPEAVAVIEAAIESETVRTGIPRIPVLAASSEAVALAVLAALDEQGLEVVRARREAT